MPLDQSGFDQRESIVAARHQAEISNPPHANVTPQPIKTPLEVQLGLTLLPARYLFRAFAKSANDSASHDWVHKYSGANAIRNLYAGGVFNKLEGTLGDFRRDHWPNIQAGWTNNGDEYITDYIKRYEVNGEKVGEKVMRDIKSMHRKWDATGQWKDTVKFFMDRGKITGTARKKIKSAMSDMVFETMYDTMLGAGSLFYTTRVQDNIYTDIMNVYSEAVSYESGKDPSDVKDTDISNSDNQIIQSTVRNYNNRRAFRYSFSMLPFAKLIPQVRALQWGEVAIGAWGVLWAYDIWGRTPTMLENFRSLVNDKLNPLYGIGDPIKASEVIDIYQQYAYRFAPEIAFKSISVNDADANRMWAQSEKLFNRIADLMNESYNFKHTTELDPETGTPKVKADFTLPKFIYLLGHGLLNARKPEWSIAFVEIANKHGMEAVKEVAKAYRNNADLSEIVARYEIDLNPTSHINGVSGAPWLAAGVSEPKDAKPLEAPAPEETPEAEKTQPAKQPTGTKAANQNNAPKGAAPRTEVKDAELEAANLDRAPKAAQQPARA